LTRASLAAALLLLASGCTLWSPGLPPAERGRRLAERTGCFSCHGAEGLKGTANPGRTDKSVPNFRDDVMMFAEDDQDVREWIRDGVSAKKKASKTWQQQKSLGTLRMPAFGRRLSARQIDDLVAFISLSSGPPAPDDSLPATGLARVRTLGCDGCHGPGGRLARPNPGSLRGFIPPWDGPDFPDLVHGRAEFEEWVNDGVAQRLDRNPVAKWFLRRAPVHMPRFEKHLQPGDMDALWAYVSWLRSATADSSRR
jgi:mono/diheme cytochrome c family protein